MHLVLYPSLSLPTNSAEEPPFFAPLPGRCAVVFRQFPQSFVLSFGLHLQIGKLPVLIVFFVDPAMPFGHQGAIDVRTDLVDGPSQQTTGCKPVA